MTIKTQQEFIFTRVYKINQQARQVIKVTTEEESLDEVIFSIEGFLKGCGFVFDHLDIVNDEK